MMTSADLHRTLRQVFPLHGLRPARPANLTTPPTIGWSDPPRDPDWAVREIVDDALFAPHH